VSRKARIRAAAAAAVALAIGLLFATGTIQGVFASFSAETENPGSAFAGGWIPAPIPTSTSIGGAANSTTTLNWTSGYNATAGTPGNHISGQQLQVADGGTGASASCGAYSNAGAALGQAIGTTTNIATAIAAPNWLCYQMVSTATAPDTWTTSAAFTPTQLFVATGLNQVDGSGTATDVVGTTDQIVITFNQNRGAIGAGNGTVQVRICTTPLIIISTVAIGSCATNAGNIGYINGQTVSANRTCATSTTAGNGTTTLTITLAACTGTANIGAGTATFHPSGTGLAASNATPLCSSAATPNCATIATTTNRY